MKMLSMYSCTSIFFYFRYRPYSCCHDRKLRHLCENTLKDENVRNNGFNAWTSVSITKKLCKSIFTYKSVVLLMICYIMYFPVVFALNPDSKIDMTSEWNSLSIYRTRCGNFSSPKSRNRYRWIVNMRYVTIREMYDYLFMPFCAQKLC